MFFQRERKEGRRAHFKLQEGGKRERERGRQARSGRQQRGATPCVCVCVCTREGRAVIAVGHSFSLVNRLKK